MILMRAQDALILARTKLKARRIRLAVLLVIMSLLFAALVAATLLVTGAARSFKSFGSEGFGGRYLVMATPMTYQTYNNEALFQQAKPLQEQLAAQKAALAKKLNLTYDPKNDQNLYYQLTQIGPKATDLTPLFTNSTLAINAIEAQNQTIPGVTYDAFAQRATAAGAIGTYRGTSQFNPASDASSIKVLRDGQENYEPQKQERQYEVTGIDSIQTLGWTQISQALLQPFLLAGQNTAVGADGSIPIVAPYSAAEQLADLPKADPDATNKQKTERLEAVRKQTAGRIAQICYRNAASDSLLQTAIQQKAEIAANKGKKDYKAPSLLYNLPSTPCGATTIASDKRTAEEKLAARNQTQFDTTFGTTSEPEQGIITVRIVGISPDISTGENGGLNARALVTSLLGSSVGNGWSSPDTAFTAGSLAAKAQNGLLADKHIDQQQYYAEFATLQASKDFIKSAGCEQDFNSDSNQMLATCIEGGTPFYVYPYGNNAEAVEQIGKTAAKFGAYGMLGIVVIAAIIMMGTFGKVIADSRRETAVFRALGASRLAISQIYLTYTVLVGLLVIAFSFMIGIVAAYAIDKHFSPDLSLAAVVAYGTRDITKEFHVFGVQPTYLLIIAGLVIASALLSAVLPLLLNMRRNPIRDMREEA